MSNEVVSIDNELKKELVLNSHDITRVADHLKIVSQAMREIMKEGIDGDFAKIPGTPKKSLLKPGAEKLMRLFGLGARFIPVENVLDPANNFAIYSYKCEVFHLKSGTIITDSEGTANSYEKKYKTRKIYQHGVCVGEEPTPVFDMINTLKKMAQKRALVGAVIVAVGASDYFTQDEDEVAEQGKVQRATQKVDSTRFDGSEINLADYVAPVGPQDIRGKKLSEIGRERLINYCEWTVKNNQNIEGKLKEFIDAAREYLRGQK